MFVVLVQSEPVVVNDKVGEILNRNGGIVKNIERPRATDLKDFEVCGEQKPAKES